MKTRLPILALCFALAARCHAADPVDCGVLTEVKVDGRGDCFLNMDGRYPSQHMSIVIFQQDRGNFDLTVLRALVGHHLKAVGAAKTYKGHPEVIVHQASDIQDVP